MGRKLTLWSQVRIVLSFIFCQLSLLSYSQWTTSGSNISFTTGNVGIGTATPNFTLDVNGLIGGAGGSCNIAPGQTLASKLTSIANTGKMLIAWNRTGGRAETDFIANTLSGAAGGFGFYNCDNSGNTNNLMYLQANGYTGIGTLTPSAPLEVQPAAALGATAGNTAEIARFAGTTSNYSQLRIFLNRFAAGSGWTTASTRIQAFTDAANMGYIDFNPNGGKGAIGFGGVNSEFMRILSTGNVLIGKTSQVNSGYLLDVNGNARANQVVVNSTGADFVFEQGYHLPDLKFVEAYVIQEHHLPGIEPAAEMQKNGLDLGANQTRLLQKIEELTLYAVQQNKEIEVLTEKVRQLQEHNSRIEALQKRIQKLEDQITKLPENN